MNYQTWKQHGRNITGVWTNAVGPLRFEVIHERGIYYLTTYLHGRNLHRQNGLDFDRLVEPIFNSCF